jgi:hypothetical protein
MTVTITNFDTRKRLRLTPIRVAQFARELKETKKRPSGKGIALRASPDCVITVQDGGHKTVYHLYGRSVLLETRTQKTWQFYFGLLLLEWLAHA